MTFTAHLKLAAGTVLMLAATAAFAGNGVGGKSTSVRSSQSLPPATSPAYHPASGQSDLTTSAAAEPPYCSGNKNGIYNDRGEKNGNGKALTCSKSPG